MLVSSATRPTTAPQPDSDLISDAPFNVVDTGSAPSNPDSGDWIRARTEPRPQGAAAALGAEAGRSPAPSVRAATIGTDVPLARASASDDSSGDDSSSDDPASDASNDGTTSGPVAANPAITTDTSAVTEGLVPIPGPGSIQNPLWSPDGSELAFTRFSKGYNRAPAVVSVLNFKDGTLKAVSPTGAESVNLPGASWGKSGRITFSSDLNGHDEVFVASPGGKAEQITHRAGKVAFEPSFSPDEKWIVFESHAENDDGHGTIWKVRVDGGDLMQLTHGADDREPNWSPAGDRILFQSNRGGSTNIWTIDVNGGSLTNVTKSKSEDTDASWSPDGSMIVYSSDRGGLENGTLFVIPKDGGDPVRVTDYKGYAGAPSWSPDGRFIAFESSAGDPDSSSTKIRIVKAPGQ
jgi:TolB protein